MTNDTILDVAPLGAPWVTYDPFLFCMHHKDHYPAGDESMGPAASLSGRNIGMDFGGKDGWSMYHGDVVPGFPRHPHRGFETVTLARNGYIDHSDSLGATARFGHGDVQWMTAGSGVVHSEMFPLTQRDAPNPTELFQIWLNLPRADKFVEPHFTMLWNQTIPRHTFTDEHGRSTEITLIAGELQGQRAPAPPPSSWASRAEAEVAIWTIRMAPGAIWTLPAASSPTETSRTESRELNRTLYFFQGATLRIGEREIKPGLAVRVRPDVPIVLSNGDQEGELLMLQGRPIGEPVVQYGPFVMNEPREIQQAMLDYQRTGFGNWPWKSDGPVHARDQGRFAIHADGREERAE